jgi:hypothetical protein
VRRNDAQGCEAPVAKGEAFDELDVVATTCFLDLPRFGSEENDGVAFGERFPNLRTLIRYRTEVVHDCFVQLVDSARGPDERKLGRCKNFQRHIVMGILKDAAKVTARNGIELVADRTNVPLGIRGQVRRGTVEACRQVGKIAVGRWG